MEASCLGVPIIGSDARGVRDVVQPNRGLIYPVGDIFALRDAMQQMFEEPYHEVRPNIEWKIENLVDMHEKLYKELLESRHPANASEVPSGEPEEIHDTDDAD
jgi:glycosyltransferase involved in cell wall biosynthesis